MDKAENDLLTRVGPGTAMGELLRRYWWPVWFSEQVTDKPVPLRLLGEDLVLFREPSGKLGLVDRCCAHRGASLEYGRVEDGGIRCCYHGWIYAASGQCIDMPMEPEGSRLKDEVKLRSGAVVEAGGLVFAYLGPAPVPVFPRWDLISRDAGLTVVGADEEHCNWLQRAENTVDPYHLGVLHAGVLPPIAMKRPEGVDYEPAWFGMNMSIRLSGRGVNRQNFVFPASNRFPQARTGETPSQNMRFRVPTDDIKTTTFWVRTYPSITDQGRLKTEGLTTSVAGQYERVPDGWWDVPSHEQDRMAQESQGAIADRTREFLGTTDRGIVLFRQMLHEALAAVAAGKDPIGVLREDRGIIDFATGNDEVRALAPA